MMIDGVEYVPVNSNNPFVIVRCNKAGVFAGYMRECDDKLRTVILDKCIRLWRWTGCSLSQVANDGIAGRGENKFSMKTNNHKVLEVIEIIPCTEKARKAIQSVPEWKI